MLSKPSYRSLLCRAVQMTISKQAHVIGPSYPRPITQSTSQLFKSVTQQAPQSIALHSFDQQMTLTYEQVYKKSMQLACGLVSILGLQPNDRIGIYSYNKWQWYICQMAAAFAGLILVNVNPAYQSQELAYTIEKVGLKVLIISDSFKRMNYLEIVRKIVPETATASEWDLKSRRFNLLKSVVRFNNAGNERQKGFVNFEDLFVPINSKILPYKFDHNAAVNIQFTSGTTGKPKAAILSHFNTLNNAYLIGEKCNYTERDNIAIPVPFYHCFGMIMGTLAALVRKASITIVCEGFDGKKALEAVTKYKCTSLYGVPTMFIQYIQQEQICPEKYQLSSLHTGIVAGALCSEVLMNKIFQVLNLKSLTNCYGMTQTSPVSFQTSPKDTMLQKTTTVGTILPGLEARVVATDGKVLSAGQIGELQVKGWSVMLGYWGDEAATKKSMVDGWMKTGDLGMLDGQGYLSIVGRIKDMIIRGGENIYPKQIEEYLQAIPGIIDVQVVGVSDDKFGEEVVAVIKVKDITQSSISKEDVLAFCKEKIAYYKIPKYVKFVEQLPLTVTGKPQKYLLRQELQLDKKDGKLAKYAIK